MLEQQTESLPELQSEKPARESPSAMITVRMVPSLHQRIREVSQREKLSINSLCLKAIELALNRYDAYEKCRQDIRLIEEEIEKEKLTKDCQPEPAAT